MDFASLDMILQQFENLFTGGMGTIQGHTFGMLQILALLDVALALLLKMAGGVQFQTLVNKILKIGFWVFVVSEYDTWINAIIDTFSELGLAAGGGNIGLEMLKHPSVLLKKGYALASGYLNWVSDTITGVDSFFANFDLIIAAYLGAGLIILAFMIIIFQVFITFIEFYIFALLAVFFLAFAVFNKTAFISEKVIGGVLSYGVKLMVLACVLSAIGPIVDSLDFTINKTPDLDHIIGACACCLTLAFVSWQAPAVASGLMNGSPSLTGGTAASNAMAGAAGGVAGAMIGAKALSPAGWAASKVPGLSGAARGGYASVNANTMPITGAARGAFSHIKGGIAGLAGEGTALGKIRNNYAAGYATGAQAVGGSSGASASEGGTSSAAGSTSERTHAGLSSSGAASASTSSSGGFDGSASANAADTASSGASAAAPSEKSFSTSGVAAKGSFSESSASGNAAASSGSKSAGQQTTRNVNKPKTGALSKMAIMSQAEKAVPPEAQPSGGMGFQIRGDD